MQMTLAIRITVAHVLDAQEITDKIMDLLKELSDLEFSASVSEQLKTAIQQIPR